MPASSEPPQPPIVASPSAMRARGSKTTSVQASSSNDKNALVRSRPLVLGILFGVTGALGLPLLWYSPSFTRNEKWLWSIANIVYTLVLLVIAAIGLMLIRNAMQQSQLLY